MVDSIEMAQKYVSQLPAAYAALATEKGRPTTLILEGAQNLAPGLIAEDGSIALRIPQDDFCLAVLKQLGKGLVSTSANISGKDFNGSYSDVDASIVEAVDYAVKYRQEEPIFSSPSRILKLSPSGEVTVIRK